MRRAALLLSCAACLETPGTEPPWRLDGDRVLAVRVTPPRLLPGEVGLLDVLVARAGGTTAVETPTGATAAFAPGDLYTAVHFNVDRWQVDGPDEPRLDVARAELGLPPGAPVPLEVRLQVAGPLFAKKVVWLGDTRENPTASFALGPALRVGLDYPLVADEPATSVRWYASCGRIEDHERAATRLHIEAPCTGEVAVVIRDEAGGVAWQTLPVRAD